MSETDQQGCPKCGCDSYTYRQVEQTVYVGRFGEYPEASDTKIVRMNKTCQCANCGFRVRKEIAMNK